MNSEYLSTLITEKREKGYSHCEVLTQGGHVCEFGLMQGRYPEDLLVVKDGILSGKPSCQIYGNTAYMSCDVIESVTFIR